MEQSISSLAFKGSIIEAITEAKRQKKLFLVYVSGDNEDSISMDKSTWSESKVAESLSKYCILLHILEGSTDAAQFSALYPQKPAPCITAIGYNGIQLWQNEGFVSGEVLASTLEKAWLSIHVQETFLSAALASRQSEQIPSEIPPSTSPEIGSSSTSSINTNSNASVDKKDANHDKKPENSAPEQKKLKVGDDVSRVPVVHKPEESKSKQPDTVNEPVKKITTSTNESGVDKKSSLKTIQHKEDNVVKPSKAVKDVPKSENLETQKDDNSDLVINKSTDIHINIRLPGGKSLQEKFEPTTILKMVKNYIDQNQESSIGSYDLAIPYPRKVFTDQDLTKSLSELNLLDRQALIVVPHLQSSKPRSYFIPNTSESAMSSPDGEGYFSLWKRALSYINPLAYLGGNGNTDPNPSQRSLPESGSEPGSFSGSRSYLVTQNQASSSRFGSGSNIHTLKHDEDDTKFNGKNAFWNGNSTEYGGDGDNK